MPSTRKQSTKSSSSRGASRGKQNMPERDEEGRFVSDDEGGSRGRRNMSSPCAHGFGIPR